MSTPDPRRLRDLGEDGLIASVLARYARTGPLPALVRIGPGDDGAVLDLAGPVVVSTDTLVEGFDFRRDWSSPDQVGVKVAAQTLADIAAMGARPAAILVSLAAPGDLPADWADGLADGLARECRRAGAVVVGGDFSQAAEVVVTGTALGLLDGPAVRRSGARVGDLVALSARTGPSAAGLALLTAGWRPAPGDRAADADAADAELASLVRWHLAPTPDYAMGMAAAGSGASALIDTSDGLLRDAARIGAASGVTLDLDSSALTPEADLVRAADVLASEFAGPLDAARPARDLALTWVLTGGEDHAMLACFPADRLPPNGFRVIGRVIEGALDAAGTGVLVDGQPWTGSPGWRHFD